MTKAIYEEIISQFSGKKILAIGDLYLDEYMLNEVLGISEMTCPEKTGHIVKQGLE